MTATARSLWPIEFDTHMLLVKVVDRRMPDGNISWDRQFADDLRNTLAHRFAENFSSATNSASRFPERPSPFSSTGANRRN
jgi:hypothetical protein